MGMHGQARITVVSYSIADGKPTKYCAHGRLQGVTMDIKGASMQTDFEGIEIVDDSNPYHSLLGIDWARVMNGVINLKK